MKRALNDFVVVKPNQGNSEEKTDAGLVLLKRKEKIASGVVQFVSTDINGKVSVGETVLYPAGSGTEVKIDDEDVLILQAHTLMFVI